MAVDDPSRPGGAAEPPDPDRIAQEFEREARGAGGELRLREIRAAYLGDRGLVAAALRRIGELPKEERKTFGRRANQAKLRIEEAFARELARLDEALREADLRRTVDVTLPGRAPALGHLHPLTAARREMELIFGELGFEVATGPQVETDFHNFEALNIPRDHPARDMQDTFYVSDDVVLRTHTSPVQIRTMLRQKPPVKIIAPGVVYRKDDDPTHSPMFSQVEGLVVDEGVRFSDLKGVLLHFVRRFFGAALRLRFRPSFFPFTEPSAEVDMQCVFCMGAGCRTCKQGGWLEIGGSGMVHPAVFRAVGYDPEAITGFAFGMGIERMAMLRHGVSDLRLFYEGDVRFLRQFV